MASIINAATSGGLISTADTSGILQLQTASTTAVTVDASQNVGIGVTPSAWRSAFNVTYGERALELTYSALVTQAGPSTILANNVYFNSSNQWIYKNAVANTNAGLYTIGSNGVHSWSVAPTGASGAVATFTQAMTLDASGNLGVGTTSPTTLVDLVRSSLTGSDVSMPNIFVRNTNATQGNGGSTFNQAVVSVSAGNGTVFGGIRAAYDSAGSYGTGMQLYVNSTNPLQFYTNNAERARIDSSGNLLVGTTTKNNMNGTLLQTLGSSGIVDSSSASVAQNGTVVITAHSSGGSFTGFLSVTNVLLSNANIRTQALYAIMGRGTTMTATQLATANGSTGGASFTVTCPSTGAITVTNTYAGATQVNMTYIGHTGG